MIPAAVVALVAIAAMIVVSRQRIADLQGVLAGGAVGPGCVVAQAVAVLILAVLIFVGWRVGIL